MTPHDDRKLRLNQTFVFEMAKSCLIQRLPGIAVFVIWYGPKLFRSL